MKKHFILITLLFCGIQHESISQKNIKSYIIGHSLIDHAFSPNPTPSQELTVPHWFHFLAKEAGHEYAVSGQYAFLPDVGLPPQSNWWYNSVKGAWDSSVQQFADVNFSNLLLTPLNYSQWQGPTEKYVIDPHKSTSPVEATIRIVDWCVDQEESLDVFIYESWPDMDAFLNNGFPPTQDEWKKYNEYLNGGYHDWFIEYHELVAKEFPNSCIRMIPVGPAISALLSQSPFDQIPIGDIYEDGAPHGRPTIYFLAAVATYMAMYEEKPPASYNVTSFIHPIIAQNFPMVIDIFWDELNNFNTSKGGNIVFCNPITTHTTNDVDLVIEPLIIPNPTSDFLTISGYKSNLFVDVYSIDGSRVISSQSINSDNPTIDLADLPNGVYTVVGKSIHNQKLFNKRVIKL